MMKRKKSRVGPIRWMFLVLAGLAGLSIGCNPQSLSMLLMPFQDTNIQPEWPLFKKNKELTLVILANFAKGEDRADLRPAATELADELVTAFRQRCEANSHKIKIVPNLEVRAKQLNLGSDALRRPVELGEQFKADYVLDLTINSISLYAKGYHPLMFRGQTDININLYKVKGKDGETRVFTKEFRRAFPNNSLPMDASSISAAGFRQLFVRKTAHDIAKIFLAYPPEERHMME
ncbi:MAG: hypothetical protein HYX68_00740 [Planctomycetes bacterium]|nr:hypothetical protein [Planctomycetota bacterium]